MSQSGGVAITGNACFASLRPNTASSRAKQLSYRGLDDLTYPFHDATLTVTHCGRICFQGRKVNLGHALAGQNVRVTQVGDPVWLVSFMQYDLGYFDDEAIRVEPIENPFGSKLLPMSPEWTFGKWSGRLDSNQRPPAPKPSKSQFRAIFCNLRVDS
jgi:hypothetical protein